MRTEEYETIILFNKVDNKWEAGTNIPEHQRMFEKKGWKFVREAAGEKAYEAGSKALIFRDMTKPMPKPPQLSEEQKQRNAERLRELSSKRHP